MDSLEIKHIKDALAPLFEIEPRVAFAYLYGSRASGKAGPMSDYDIAVFFDEPNIAKRHDALFRLDAEVSKVLKTNAVDIHCLNDMQTPELKFNIIL